MILFAFLPCFCASWWAHAHMIITDIALKSLSTSKQKQLQYIINQNYLPTQSVVRSSAWQDDLKDDYHIMAMGNWHFSDNPLIRNETKPVHIQSDSYNVTNFLDESWITLNDPTTTSMWSWSFLLRSIIHFVGDVHTPHHNVALYSDQFVGGDQGGNAYKLNCPYGSVCNNIHFLWDAVGLEYQINNPLIQKHIDKFNENVSRVMKDYPIGDLNTEFAPHKWSKEAFDIADKYGYETGYLDFPNKTYIDIVRKYGNQMVAIAGYRLGRALNDILDKAPKIEESHFSEIAIWVINSILFIFCIVVSYILRRKTHENEFESLTQNTNYN